ncbi:MAG: hypothetical protein VX564_02400 [Nitrospirota bacterium]|nr:hypothetical protein [Nitrospirota bacterium]
MNQTLADLYRCRLISPSTALTHSVMPDELRQVIHRTDLTMKE